MSDLEFTDYLGVRTLGMQDGAFVLELDLEPRHMSRAARAHGGVLFSLLDTALGRAVIEELPPGRCVQRTKSLAYAEGDVDVDGESIALVTKPDLIEMKERSGADPRRRRSRALQDRSDAALLRGDVPDEDEGW